MCEYLEFRCCLCPNIGKNENVCPAIEGTPHTTSTPCRFVKSYIDDRGWKYKVKSGIGDGAFKARYQKPDKEGDNGWKGVSALPWRKTFDQAQADLNELAKKKCWREWTE